MVARVEFVARLRDVKTQAVRLTVPPLPSDAKGGTTAQYVKVICFSATLYWASFAGETMS